MRNEFLLMRLTSYQSHTFPFQDGDESAGETEFGDFAPGEDLNHLMQLPGTSPADSQNDSQKVGFQLPTGGSLDLRVDVGSILVNNHSHSDAMLEVYRFLRQRYEDLVIVATDNGMIFNEEAFRNAFIVEA